MKLRAIAASLTAALTLLTAGCGGSEEPIESSSASFDRSFIDAMVPHHESAIEMAKAAKRGGLSEPVLVDIADAIIATQQAEIDKMTEWRAEWFGVAAIDPDGGDRLGMSSEEMGMQHDNMDFETASDVDAAFASAMIDHHDGAVAMARLAIARAEHQEILTLADEIITAQKTEIEQMMPFASSGSMDGMGHG